MSSLRCIDKVYCHLYDNTIKTDTFPRKSRVTPLKLQKYFLHRTGQSDSKLPMRKAINKNKKKIFFKVTRERSILPHIKITNAT